MRFKERRNQSTILLSYISWCCQYSQSTKELGYFRKLQNQTNHVPAPQRKASRTCDLAGLAPWGDRQGSRKITAGKPRSRARARFRRSVPGLASAPLRGRILERELCLSYPRTWPSLGRAALGEEFPGPLALCPLGKVVPVT